MPTARLPAGNISWLGNRAEMDWEPGTPTPRPGLLDDLIFPPPAPTPCPNSRASPRPSSSSLSPPSLSATLGAARHPPWRTNGRTRSSYHRRPIVMSHAAKWAYLLGLLGNEPWTLPWVVVRLQVSTRGELSVSGWLAVRPRRFGHFQLSALTDCDEMHGLRGGQVVRCGGCRWKQTLLIPPRGGTE